MRTLTDLHHAGPTRAVVLMLHGGAEEGLDEVGGRAGPVRRTRWMAASIRPRLAAQDIDVALLRFSVRGWNAGLGEPSPLADARWALEEIADRYGEPPVVLLGHSMGARTALHVADHPSVAGVVGLAPWFPADEDVRTVAGKRLIAAHGSRDRITSARHTRRLLERAAEAGARTTFVDMGDVGHYMLRRVRRWNDVAASACLDVADATPD